MTWIVFVAFIIALIFVFIVSAFFAHISIKTAAGWWAGVFLSVLLFLTAQPFFQSLPEKVVRFTENAGCGQVRVRETKEVDWDTFVSEIAQIDIVSVLAGFVFCCIAFEILKRLPNISDRLVAFICLCLAFCSLSSLLYVFLIRKLAYLIFSFALGAIVGAPIYVAFVLDFKDVKGRWKNWMEDSSKVKK